MYKKVQQRKHIVLRVFHTSRVVRVSLEIQRVENLKNYLLRVRDGVEEWGAKVFSAQLKLARVIGLPQLNIYIKVLYEEVAERPPRYDYLCILKCLTDFVIAGFCWWKFSRFVWHSIILVKHCGD